MMANNDEFLRIGRPKRVFEYVRFLLLLFFFFLSLRGENPTAPRRILLVRQKPHKPDSPRKQ